MSRGSTKIGHPLPSGIPTHLHDFASCFLARTTSTPSSNLTLKTWKHLCTCRGPRGAACPGPPRGRPALSIGLRADSSPRLPRALSGQPGLRCAVGPLARRRGSARAAAVSGGGAGRAVHRRERCTGVDSREWNATTKRAHTFWLPADRSHQTHQWHVQAIMFQSTVNQPTTSRHP